MADELTPVDLTTDHELIWLEEGVRRTGKAGLLPRGDENLAVLSFALALTKRPARTVKTYTKDDDAAFLSAAH
ncbi:MAG: hypothetical protein ACKVVP_08550 [Chloroflexota bacterium]